ncbi:hypothetical protein EDD22DRAFT_905539 [Suillus occidentalis]|nr:hypothetical protein EDD22DRAFT_905539 [Suillus occidentalis]
MEGAAIHDDSTTSTLLGDVTFRTIPAADASLYKLTSEEAVFFKAQIGIDDDEDLKRHILEVQAKAYKIAPYPCIHGFVFLRLNISSYPVYEHILKLGRERPDAVLLDLGCCFGNFSSLATNFSKRHQLLTLDASFPEMFLIQEFLSIAAQPNDVSSAPAIDLSSLKSLNPLHGRISAISATRLFHLFTEDKQLHLARALAGLLSAQPGSVICGYQFAHSPKTWSSLWDGEVFDKGSVKVETELVEVAIHEVQFLMLGWSVVRL